MPSIDWSTYVGMICVSQVYELRRPDLIRNPGTLAEWPLIRRWPAILGSPPAVCIFSGVLVTENQGVAGAAFPTPFDQNPPFSGGSRGRHVWLIYAPLGQCRAVIQHRQTHS